MCKRLRTSLVAFGMVAARALSLDAQRTGSSAPGTTSEAPRSASSARGTVSSAQRTSSTKQLVLAAAHAYRASLDSLHARAEQLRSAAPPRDSLRAGALRIQATTPLSGGTRQALQHAADAAWRDLHVSLGDSAVVATTNLALLYREDTARSLFDRPSAHIWQARVLARGNALTLPLNEHETSDVILDQLGSTAAAALPAQLSAWVGAWIPARRLTKGEWADVAVLMATSNAAVVRGCHSGAVSSCASALVLTPVSDPFTEWYAPEDWQVIASTYTHDATDSSKALHHACAEQRLAEACLRIFRSRDVPVPLPTAARHSLVAFALERGGQGAYARLLAANGTSLDMLASAASLAPDSLLAAWRVRVIDAPPHTVRPKVLEATLLLGWALAFGALAGRKQP